MTALVTSSRGILGGALISSRTTAEISEENSALELNPGVAVATLLRRKGGTAH